MKVTIYALHLGFGGVEKYVSNIANMLSEKHEVRIVSTYKMKDEPAFYLKPDVEVEYLITDLKPNREEFHNAIKQKNIPAIIREGYKSIKVLILKKKLNIRSIKECNDDAIISTRNFHNYLIGKYADSNIVKIATEHNHHNDNEKYINDVINSCRGFDYFLPVSKELCDFYKDKMDEINVKTRYIRYGLDEGIISQKPVHDTDDIIYVGRLSKEKGVYELLDVFNSVLIKKNGVKLHIVGDGAEAEEMKNRVSELNINDKVVFHGFRNKEYIYELLTHCAVYLMTSYTESFGIVLLEAMSCGIPCVAYDSAQGAKEIIKNDYNGYLIENRNKEFITDKIITIIENKEIFYHLSENALKTADLFTYENTKKGWLSLLDEIN